MFPSTVFRVVRPLFRPYSTINVIGVPFSGGQPKSGTELGPKVLRESDFIGYLRKKGHQVSDSGDIHVSQATSRTVGKIKNVAGVSEVNRLLSEEVASSTENHDVTIVIGGDHSLAIGSLVGHTRTHPKLAVIWIDAHTDINTSRSSPSGNLHGMPLSFVIRGLMSANRSIMEAGHFDWVPTSGVLSSKDLAFIGIRDVDEGEAEIMNDLKPPILAFSAADVAKVGPKDVIRRVLESINPKMDRKIHVSFDVDSLDPKWTPSTGTPVQNGLSPFDVEIMAEVIKSTGLMSVLDVVEINPKIGSTADVGETCRSTLKVIQAFF